MAAEPNHAICATTEMIIGDAGSPPKRFQSLDAVENSKQYKSINLLRGGRRRPQIGVLLKCSPSIGPLGGNLQTWHRMVALATGCVPPSLGLANEGTPT
eukprot:1147842-Pelagomonas_calceolata.AAC.1